MFFIGKSSQRKGADGERELASILQEYGYPVERGGSLSFGEVPDITGLPGIHCEVKRHERLEIPAWLRQARTDADRFGDGIPAVFFRQNRQGWAVVMQLEDWLALYNGKKRRERERGCNIDAEQRKSTSGPSDA